MRVLVLLVVLFACHVSCQRTLEKSQCNFSKNPTRNSFIKLQMKNNTRHERTAKLTMHYAISPTDTDSREFTLDLRRIEKTPFLLYLGSSDWNSNCDIDVDGVIFEEIENPVKEIALGSEFVVVGAINNEKLTFSGIGGQPLYLMASGYSGQLNVLTGDPQRWSSFTVSKDFQNVLHIPANDLLKNQKIEVTIDLQANESLFLKTNGSAAFEIPVNTLIHYDCTLQCHFPLKQTDIFVQISGLGRPATVNKGKPNEYIVASGYSYIRKTTLATDVFGSDAVLVMWSRSSYNFEILTTNLIFNGQEASGHWNWPVQQGQAAKAFDVEVYNLTTLTFSVNNKLAQEETDMQRTVLFNPKRTEFFYISRQEHQDRFKFQIKTNKDSTVRILQNTVVPTEVLLGAGSANMLESNQVGVIQRPADDKNVFLKVQRSPKSSIKVGSKLVDLDNPFTDTLRSEDFGNWEYLYLTVFGDRKVNVMRMDKNATVSSSPHVKAAAWMVVGVASFSFLFN